MTERILPNTESKLPQSHQGARDILVVLPPEIYEKTLDARLEREKNSGQVKTLKGPDLLKVAKNIGIDTSDEFRDMIFLYGRMSSQIKAVNTQ